MVNPNEVFDEQTRLELEAAAFRRLINHLDERKDVQNIDLMNLAGFCRNCLSKWYRAEAEERGHELDYERLCMGCHMSIGNQNIKQTFLLRN